MRATEFIIEAANPAQQAAIAIAKKEEQGVAEGNLKELSTNKLAQYKKAAGADAKKADADGDYARGDKRFKGINKATNKQFDNDLKKYGQQGVAEDWNKVNHHDKTDGMSGKAVKAYRRENPGSKLKTAVTTKPSKLKAGSKDANRRKSFCARMGGNKGPMKDEKGRPTPKAKALRRWNCESIEELQELVMIAEQFVNKRKNESI
jgi:hypothetical protein